MKYDALMTELIKDEVLGHVRAHTATIEFQKEVCHTRISFMDQEAKPNTPDKIGKIVSAEIPDKLTHPQLLKIITTHNVHDPLRIHQ